MRAQPHGSDVMNEIGRIDVVSAGAGTGKTWRLGQAYLDAVEADISPARIIATTFTVKAADELTQRVRTRLIDADRPQAAQAVLGGLIGTVHSVCGSIIRDNAVAAGLSPATEVLGPDQAQSLFRIAADDAIREAAPQLESVAERLGWADTWTSTVQELVELARANRLGMADLKICAEQSWQGLRRHLRTPLATGQTENLDAAIRTALDEAVRTLERSDDTTKATSGPLEDALRPAQRQMARGQPLTWHTWAKLSKAHVAKRSQAAVNPVNDAAARHAEHPRLHSDIETFIRGVFDCAATALNSFDTFKRERGLLDFADQEALALDLLRRPEVRARLRERFDILMVDEFQDTSPIQLAIFLELARAVPKAIWVGDQKQAIFAFRGTDPGLVQAVLTTVRPATGGQEDVLDTSRRSRPDLIHFSNALFTRAFPPNGIPADKVRISNIHRHEPNGFGPALNVWHVGGKNWDESMAALAQRIRSMLADPEATPIVDRETERVRAIRPADVAVLCRSNKRCRAIADALSHHGIASAMPRAGLLKTPEVLAASAALRYLVDPHDTLAVADLLRLWGHTEWLSTWLDRGRDAITEGWEVTGNLDAQRKHLAELTPREALEAAIAAAEVDVLVRDWPEPEARLGNLDALRREAAAFEETCHAQHAGATAGGLVAHLAHGLEGGGEQPAFQGDNAVRVLTYHKAKGLEWPVVVLMDLQHGLKGSPFGLFAEPGEHGFDPWNPLANRHLRFWPWPYGPQSSGVHLDATAADSPEARQRSIEESAESVRLLYVGVTRARDYLVLAPRTRASSKWLDALTDDSGSPVLDLPDETATTITVGQTALPVSVATLTAGDSNEPPAETSPHAWFAPARPGKVACHYPPATLTPSGLPLSDSITAEGPAETHALGGRLPITGHPDMSQLGEAVHGFMAADDQSRDTAWRHEKAARVLARWAIDTALDPASLVAASDRLVQWLHKRWPEARILREVPVFGTLGLQRVNGQIDMLLEDVNGYVVIDHKTFPGPPETWEAKAMRYAPQLGLYAAMVAQATGKDVLGCWIHMPIVGQVIRVPPPQRK